MLKATKKIIIIIFLFFFLIVDTVSSLGHYLNIKSKNLFGEITA